MKEVIIYTDGACSGNPGPGGWGAILIYGEHRKEISGYAPLTTNQRMELTAVIEGLKQLTEACQVKVYSDSAYLINAFNQNWLWKWQKNGWKNIKRNRWKTRICGRNCWNWLINTKWHGIR